VVQLFGFLRSSVMRSSPLGQAPTMVAAADSPHQGDAPPDLDAGQVSALVQDGLLMVFGPDGDPVPPRSFAVAAEARPDAPVALGEGASAPAAQVARVLEAQLGGPLASPDAAGPWLRAMLGLGPLPADAAAAELDDEADPFELTLCGETLSIVPRAGGAFRLAPAPAGAPGPLELYGRDGDIIALADALAGLRAAAGRGLAVDPGPGFSLVGCSLTPAAGGLALVTASGEPLHLRPAAGGTVALTHDSGEPATLDELAAALGFALEVPAPQAAPPPAAGAVEPAPAPPSPPAAGPATTLPLHFRPPLDAASDRTRIAVVYLSGVPEGAALTTGSANGDGGWMLSAQDLEQVALVLPSPAPAEVVLEATAIVIEDRDGGMATVTQEVAAAAGPRPADPVVVALDPADLLADCGGRPNAVLIGGVPAEGQLSAGRFDGQLGSWVLRPAEIEGLRLSLTPPLPARLTLKVTVVAIERAGGRTNAVTRLLDLAPAAAARGDAATSAAPVRGVGFFRPLAARQR
jgi:hypothetical protein